MAAYIQTVLGVQCLSQVAAGGLATWLVASRQYPAKWQKEVGGLAVATEWVRANLKQCVKGGDITGNDYTAGLYVDEVTDLAWPYREVSRYAWPNALLVRGQPAAQGGFGPDANGNVAELARWSAWALPGGKTWDAFYNLCSAKAAKPWAVWMTSPTFWPQWFQHEARRLAVA